MEKEITTPDYYPLTLNALLNACNQKSNRDPAVNYDEDTVALAIEGLRDKRLATEITGYGNRVPKYGHRVAEVFNLGRREFAILCVLMLRGPQTPGELRTHSDRMYSFGDLEEIDSCLTALMDRQPDPFVTRLPRLPGTKEARYAHLLSGEPELATAAEPPREMRGAATDRTAALEAEIARVREELECLRAEFEAFRRQFS